MPASASSKVKGTACVSEASSKVKEFFNVSKGKKLREDCDNQERLYHEGKKCAVSENSGYQQGYSKNEAKNSLSGHNRPSRKRLPKQSSTTGGMSDVSSRTDNPGQSAEDTGFIQTCPEDKIHLSVLIAAPAPTSRTKEKNSKQIRASKITPDSLSDGSRNDTSSSSDDKQGHTMLQRSVECQVGGSFDDDIACGNNNSLDGSDDGADYHQDFRGSTHHRISHHSPRGDGAGFGSHHPRGGVPPPPVSPSALSATDRAEEMAGFMQRLRVQQEQNGVCDATTKNESGNHHCPILWRTRSLNAPSPIQQFGPCGRIMRNSAMVMTIQDPASQRLTWYKPPLSVLVVKKVRDAMVIPPFLELVTWLTQEKRMVVFVEASVLNDRLVTGHAKFPAVKDKLMSFRETHDDLTDKIDFIICLGGDGTLLYASSLFQQSVPPVMAFHLGSLGFLTPFKFNNYQEQVTNVLEGHAALTLRSRLRCIILRRGQEKQLPPSHHPPLPSTFNSTQTAQPADDKTSQSSNSNVAPPGTQKAPTNLLVLNEVVIDRGPSPYLSNLDLYLDGKRITSVQGDGLIVSTPTGSTAYAVAAGASMIHPSVPAIMVTPICPHSLSFRPIVVPAGVELKITVSKDSRNTAWVSFDGRMRQELKHDDSLRVTTSIYPVPSICAEDQIADWFASLDECLRWNDRKRQRHLDDVVENDTNDSESSSPNASMPTTPTTVEKEAAGGLQRVLEKGETVEDEEEEEELEPEA